MKRNVIVYKFGNVSNLDQEILSCWMVDNFFPNTIDPSGTGGNASDGGIVWAMKQASWAILMSEKAESQILKRLPQLQAHERTEYSNLYCRQLWCNTYQPGASAEDYE